MPRDCARFAPFHVSRKCCIFIFYFENLLRWNFLVCLHINYRYVNILVQIGQPVATSGKSATPIDEKCARFAPPDATCDAVVLTVHNLTCFQLDNLFKSTNELLLWKLSAIKKQK